MDPQDMATLLGEKLTPEELLQLATLVEEQSSILFAAISDVVDGNSIPTG